jgi:hypothetical protein
MPSERRRSSSGVDYLLAVPTAGGSTRFWDLICPAVGGCNAPIARAGSDVQTRSTATPTEVHLASLPGGAHALVTLEPSATDGARVDLRVLDGTLTPSAVELPTPLLVGESATSNVVATEVRAVTDGALVTVVVAALVRDSLRREDHVVLAGFRACTER